MQRFNKNKEILWTFVPEGILLNNTETGEFIELLGDAFKIWSYADGSNTAEGIYLCVSKEINEKNLTRKRVNDLLNKLVEKKFMLIIQ